MRRGAGKHTPALLIRFPVRETGTYLLPLPRPVCNKKTQSRDSCLIGIELSTMKLAFSVVFLLSATATLCGQTRTRGPPVPARRQSFSVVEATIPEMQAAMKEGRVTSRELVTQYLLRIALYNSELNALITVNPNAFSEADDRDRERATGKVRGPLHGIPIALKDNMQTVDMPTTGGALAFRGLIPPYEATLTKNLRDAGAIIIAKTTMTELANWVAGGPTPMPGGYNGLIGYSMNPYDPRRDPRGDTFDGRPVLATGGSRCGVGKAANFWAANVGSETSGSILSPSNQNMLVGIKPTVGRISRHGIIPITADQDTAGPMAKSVTDAAVLLGVLESPAPDPNDPATQACAPPPNRDYTRFLKRDGLKGARVGIPRAFYYDRITPPGGDRAPASGGGRGGNGGGTEGGAKQAVDDAIAVLTQQGAIVVDPADIPSIVDKDPQNSFLAWDQCAGANHGKGQDDDCSVVFKYGMKR